MQLWLTYLMQTLHWFEWALRNKIVKVAEVVEGENAGSLHSMAGILRFLQGLILPSQYLSVHLTSSGIIVCKCLYVKP
jgi:hypothetical protein